MSSYLPQSKIRSHLLHDKQKQLLYITFSNLPVTPNQLKLLFYIIITTGNMWLCEETVTAHLFSFWSCLEGRDIEFTCFFFGLWVIGNILNIPLNILSRLGYWKSYTKPRSSSCSNIRKVVTLDLAKCYQILSQKIFQIHNERRSHERIKVFWFFVYLLRWRWKTRKRTCQEISNYKWKQIWLIINWRTLLFTK